MRVIDEVEHEDGSATYTFDMTEEERKLVMEQGLLWMLVSGITGATPTSVMEKYVSDKALDELAKQAQEMYDE